MNCKVLAFVVFFVLTENTWAQEIKIFRINDFDLVGQVKSCLVNTAYGKEEYYFNEEGLLTKSVTRYNDEEYDGTHYKYNNGHLVEKRLEHYRDNTFDSAASVATVYLIDSTANLKITEKIVSYTNDFIDQYEYEYEQDILIKITRSNHNGIDETLISHLENEGELTTSYTLNGELDKTKRTTYTTKKDSLLEKSVEVKKYIDGILHSAVNEIFDGKNKLISKTQFLYNETTTELEPQEIENYAYDVSGVLLSCTITKGNVVEEKEYVYQFDENKNWVKEIITPDNAYKTRKITYYPAENSLTLLKE